MTTHPWDTLGRFARMCGPAVVASVLNVHRHDAAKILRSVGEHRALSTSLSAIAQVLDKEIEQVILSANEVTVDGPGVLTAKQLHPTLARWLSENAARNAVVRVSMHALHVVNGTVVEDNGYTPMRGRVTHVIWLD